MNPQILQFLPTLEAYSISELQHIEKNVLPKNLQITIQ